MHFWTTCTRFCLYQRRWIILGNFGACRLGEKPEIQIAVKRGRLKLHRRRTRMQGKSSERAKKNAVTLLQGWLIQTLPRIEYWYRMLSEVMCVFCTTDSCPHSSYHSQNIIKVVKTSLQRRPRNTLFVGEKRKAYSICQKTRKNLFINRIIEIWCFSNLILNKYHV
jgi:hypothetical protein